MIVLNGIGMMNIHGGQKQEILELPSAYQRVEYLESTGTQYIDTGYFINPKTKIECEIQFTDTTIKQQRIFESADTVNTRLDCYVKDSLQLGWNWTEQDNQTNLNVNTNHTIDTNKHKIVIDGVNKTVKLDNIYSSTIAGNLTKTSTTSLTIMAYVRPHAQAFAYLKLYDFKIYDNGELVRNFVACYRKNDNVAGLYDLVNDVFYANSGTGTFNVGENKNNVITPSLENPTEIKYVENSVTIISSNKNMYQAPESIISNGVSFTKNEDDSFDIVGIATNQANTYKYVDCNDTCIKDGEIYTFSCNQALPSGLLLLCEEYENNTWKSHLFEHSLSGNTILRTKVISLKGNRIRFGLRVESGTNINVKGLKIQIEKDNKNTDIVKHKGETLIMPIQKPLKAIQDVRDSFVKKNGIWYERHYIKRAYFDGSEEWHLSGNTSNISFWGKANSIMEGLDLTKIAQTNNGSNTYLPHILSNYFKIVSLSNFFKDSICATCDYYNNNLELRLGLGLNSDITTVAQLKAKLEELSNSGNPLYVDYVLAEPELIKCTEEQSKILDKINTYKNTTIITTDNDIAKVSLKYKVDVLKAIENATAVAEQEVE